MKIAMALVVLAVFAGAIAWVVISLRKFQARKAFEREREANFMAEILKAKAARPAAPAANPGPDPATSPPLKSDASPATAAPAAGSPPAAGGSTIAGLSASAGNPTAATATAAADAAVAAHTGSAAHAGAASPATKPADPLAEVAETIKSALAAGRGTDAAKAFLGIVAQRTRLTLEPPVWEGLGRALLAQGAFLESAWALHAGAVIAGDLAGAQKRLVEVAARAGDAGQPQNALKLYATLLAKYPQSQYADFVRANMKQEERKLAKG
ncbi:MAG TPA: hypothetical protein VF876_04820 [Burkholderiales bacterium]